MHYLPLYHLSPKPMSESSSSFASSPVSKSVQALRDFLASPEGKAHMEEYAAEQVAEHKALIAYFGSPEFDVTYNKLVLLTADGDCVQSEDYGEPHDTVTNDELLRFSYSLDKRVAEGHDGVDTVQELPPCPFSTHTLKYKALLIQTTCGQGCFTRVSRATDTNHNSYVLLDKEDGEESEVD